MKRIIICLLSALALALCACSMQTSADTQGSVPSEAEVSPFDPCTVGVIIKGERISVQKDIGGGGYTLYLPSFSKDIVWSLSGDTVLNGNTITDGESAEILNSAMSVTFGNFEVKIMLSANIPALFLTSDEGTMDNINASADHSYSTGGAFSLLSADGETLAAGRLKKIRGRGNATWQGEKKPYQIELSSKESLLGLAEAKKYILLANYYDPSLLRNSLAFELAKAYEGYSVSGEPVDLYACGEYLGSYLLCEKIEIADNKIDIFDLEDATEELVSGDMEDYERTGDVAGAQKGSAKWFELPAEPEDMSGGYLLEVEYTERYPNEVSGFVTERGLPVAIVSPECASRTQVEYIKEYVCDFEDALYSKDGYNEKGRHYSYYADMDSLIFRYLFEEFVLNIDGGISSFHIYKDSDENGGKLNFSCVWDYDCSFGNYDKFADLTSPELFFTGENETRNNGSMPSWFNALLARDEIRELMKEYYSETFRPAVLAMAEAVPILSERIKKSAEMDHHLYGSFDKRNFYGADSGSDFEGAVAYLESFILRRLDFFDRQFGLDIRTIIQ